MSKRYEEPADVEAPDGDVLAFWWRGRRYRIRAVLSRWREAGGWWESPADTAQPWARGHSREFVRVDAVPESENVPAGTRRSGSGDVSAGTPVNVGTRAGLRPVPRSRHPAGRKLRTTRAPAGVYELCRDLRKGTWSMYRILD